MTVLDSTTGELVRKKDIVDGGVHGLAYVDEGRSLLVVDSERTFVVDAETLRPRGEAFEIPIADPTGGIRNVTAIGDGSTAMVHEAPATAPQGTGG